MVRHRNRYVLLDMDWRDKTKRDEGLNESALLNVLRDSILVQHGAAVLEALNAALLRVKYYNPYTNMCIVRCDRDLHRKVVSAFVAVKDIRLRKVDVRLYRVTGTIRSCLRVAWDHHVRAMKAVLPHLPDKHVAIATSLEDRLRTLEM